MIDLVVGASAPEAWTNTTWSLADYETWRRETAGITAAGGPARRVLVAREIAGRNALPGIELVEAWRYLLEKPAG